MPATLEGRFVVAIASRALFDFERENRVFEADGDAAYSAFQLERLDEAAQPGVAFPLVRKLLRFNDGERELVEVVVLSRNDPVSGLRVFRSADALKLPLTRGVFTRGQPPFGYLRPLGAHLFLSANDADVRGALEQGFPAARVFPESAMDARRNPDELRVAFDGDAVLFSDEAESVYRNEGLAGFERHERERANTPLPPGPFQPMLSALQQLQIAAGETAPVRIRTALVTARSAPAHERAIRTLMDWGVRVDEAMFLGGLEKGPFLREFEPDFFFDDQTTHCESGAIAGPTGHVIAGVANPLEPGNAGSDQAARRSG